MNILCIFYTQNRQTFQTKNHQECKSSVNFTLLISIRFSFPHKFSLCIFIKFLSSDLLKIIFYFFVSTSTFVPAIVRYQIFSFPVLSTFRKRKWTSYSSPARCSSVSMMPVYAVSFACKGVPYAVSLSSCFRHSRSLPREGSFVTSPL